MLNAFVHSTMQATRLRGHNFKSVDVVLRVHGSTKFKIAARLQFDCTSGQIDLMVMAGRGGGAAAARGRGRSGLNKGATAGRKRKAQDVLCTEHNNGNTTPRQAAAQPQLQQTTKSVRAFVQQEVKVVAGLPLLLQLLAFLY